MPQFCMAIATNQCEEKHGPICRHCWDVIDDEQKENIKQAYNLEQPEECSGDSCKFCQVEGCWGVVPKAFYHMGYCKNCIRNYIIYQPHSQPQLPPTPPPSPPRQLSNATPHSIDSMVQQVQDAMTTAAKPKPKGKAKGKKASKATKKTSPTSPLPIIKRPAGNFKAFPGVPNKPTPPRDLGNGMKLYTDLGSGAWRLKCKGQTKERTFTWKTDAKAAWERLSDYVSAA